MNRNQKTLDSFVAYCASHPEERFWQALRNWSEYGFVLVANDANAKNSPLVTDTFYWEGQIWEPRK